MLLKGVLQTRRIWIKALHLYNGFNLEKHACKASMILNGNQTLNCVQVKSLCHNHLQSADITHLICLPRFNSHSNLFSTASDAEPLDVVTYERVCEETLESLTDYIEELLESNTQLKDTDITNESGVLTVKLGPSHGTYVINRQTPNRQIWLSSPTSGPKRYDFVSSSEKHGDNGFWVYKHDAVSLHQLLQNEFRKIFEGPIDFSHCSYSGILK